MENLQKLDVEFCKEKSVSRAAQGLLDHLANEINSDAFSVQDKLLKLKCSKSIANQIDCDLSMHTTFLSLKILDDMNR